MSTNITVKKLSFPWETKDPFLFCAHHKDAYPEGNENLGVDFSELKGRNAGQDFIIKDGYRMYHGTSIPGFPYHPHRGFETITINKSGFVDHTDSLGASGRFGAGDVQWMTAGKGVQHSEMFPLIYADKPNPLEIFQIWLNLARKNKMAEPQFKMLWKNSIPKLTEPDTAGTKTYVDVIVGTYKNAVAPDPTPDSWAANPEHGVTILIIEMEAGTEWTLPAYKNNTVNRTLYFYGGESIIIDGKVIENYNLIECVPTENLSIRNNSKTQAAYLLLLQGEPINEPVAQYGPFVMNTAEEIQDAFKDYQRTEFGGWPWPGHEFTHGRNKGRFADYGNGNIEELPLE